MKPEHKTSIDININYWSVDGWAYQIFELFKPKTILKDDGTGVEISVNVDHSEMENILKVILAQAIKEFVCGDLTCADIRKDGILIFDTQREDKENTVLIPWRDNAISIDHANAIRELTAVLELECRRRSVPFPLPPDITNEQWEDLEINTEIKE